MMDTTTSREEFEKWLKLKMPTTYKLAFECGDDDEFTNLAKASVLDMRTAWQSSRESIEKKAPPKIENHMSQPIAVLDISSRTKNAILNGGISTIGDLLRMGHLGVLKVPGIGRGCEAEIKSALANLSIEWKPWGESE
ncbi:DNA-directed RNA polymerase subunit alpha C-terminal domain-containing protein [Yersinia rohdei]|uniref:DNA-directed RNA polymerase subunit alpha C-terminal domain-containing protein n=1 Tax=Yersinia rohdei TaxID=29485 RepID=UPI00119F28DD|nr:DNA-directed RNA polymerase subunit alpha C-terminal domain-containing protein [Yersinia rohdei]